MAGPLIKEQNGMGFRPSRLHRLSVVGQSGSRTEARPAGFGTAGDERSEPPRFPNVMGATNSQRELVRARQDSNLRPLAPEANALSS